jgi:hypothetical protein
MQRFFESPGQKIASHLRTYFYFQMVLSTATMSYREVALVNGAFWIGRGRSGEEAREAFEAVLREFPESGFAKISKRMMFANDTRH